MRHATLVLLLLAATATAQSPPDPVARIRELEAKLTGRPGRFDYDTRSELVRLYATTDPKKAMGHAEAILKRRRFDPAMEEALGGVNKEKRRETLLKVAEDYADLPHVAATCLVWAGELEAKPEARLERVKAALAVKGLTPEMKEAVDDHVLFSPANRKPWPAKIAAPKGMEESPGPWADPADLTAWPNTTSRANGDDWLTANHDKLTDMRPRLLLVNFSNEHDRPHLERLAAKLIDALAESTTYHGYADAKAPAFLKYEVFKFVDLRDRDRKEGNSRLIPVKNPDAKRGYNFKYRQLFTDEFAAHYGVPDPRDAKRFLRLDELLDGGYVHEVWFFDSGSTTAKPHVGALEVVEQKPRYDDKFARLGGWVQSGNGGDDDMPWVGRSCRVGCVNASRGIGCFLESLAHGMEGMANGGAVPYFTRYFHEYADHNLDTRYKLPFRDLYQMDYDKPRITYPDQTTAVFTHAGKEHRVENYTPVGGCAHFPPNARGHYDLDNKDPVLCTLADWRIGSGPGGKDKAEAYTRDTIKQFRDKAPDCMGAWLIYWRQNMPGRDNKQKADGGGAMKNWWPFLFY